MSQVNSDCNTVGLKLPELKLTELFVEAGVIKNKLGLSSKTLQILRRERAILQGIHYTTVNGRLLLYNLPLMLDWLANRHDPDAHLRAIENFQASLLSNKPKPKGRK